MMKKITIILSIFMFLGCKDSTKKEETISYEETVSFLIDKLDKRNVKLYDDQNATEVKFEFLDGKKCYCEYSYIFEWNSPQFKTSPRKIAKFDFADANFISSYNTGGGIFGVIEMSFEKESVYYGTNKYWGDEVTIYVSDKDVHQIGKALKRLKEICVNSKNTTLFKD